MENEELERLENEGDEEAIEEYYSEQFEAYLNSIGDDSNLTIDDFDFGFEVNNE